MFFNQVREYIVISVGTRHEYDIQHDRQVSCFVHRISLTDPEINNIEQLYRFDISIYNIVYTYIVV